MQERGIQWNLSGEFDKNPLTFECQVAARQHRTCPQSLHQSRIKAACAEKCCLKQHLAALLLDGTTGRDEDELSVGVRRLVGGRLGDFDRPAGDVGGQKPEPVRVFRGERSDGKRHGLGSGGHVWGRTVLTSSSSARITSSSSDSTWTTAAWTALRRFSPSAARPPARINIRVEDTSRKGEPSRLRMAYASLTKERAVS